MVLYFILYLLLPLPAMNEREFMVFLYYYYRKRRTVSSLIYHILFDSAYAEITTLSHASLNPSVSRLENKSNA